MWFRSFSLTFCFLYSELREKNTCASTSQVNVWCLWTIYRILMMSHHLYTAINWHRMGNWQSTGGISWKRTVNCIPLMLKLCIFWYNLDLRTAFKAVTCCCKERKVLPSPPFSAGYSNFQSLLDILQSYLSLQLFPLGESQESKEAQYLQLDTVERKGSKKYQSLLKRNAYGNSHCHAWESRMKL